MRRYTKTPTEDMSLYTFGSLVIAVRHTEQGTELVAVACAAGKKGVVQ